MTILGATAQGLTAMTLAEALCARICHDLSSPLGTLMGALEMVAEDPDAAEDAMPIANETAAAMGARLRLLRAAWAGDCGPLDVAQLTELACGLPSRARADLAGLGDSAFEGPVARIVLNLLLLGVEALPRGGVLALTRQSGGDILLTAVGKAAAWPEGLGQALHDPHGVSLDNPRAVQAPLTVMLTQAAGWRLSLLAGSPDGKTVDFGAAPPLLLSAH